MCVQGIIVKENAFGSLMIIFKWEARQNLSWTSLLIHSFTYTFIYPTIE